MSTSSLKTKLPSATSTSSLLGKRFQRWLDQRIPANKKTTLTQRSIFIFPSKTGGAFFILLFLLLFGAINYQNTLIYAVTFLLGSLFLVTIFHTYKNLSGISLEFIQSKSGFVGENIEFQVKISQPSGYEREGIRIGWPAGIKQWVQLHDSDSTTMHLFIPANQRGWMNPGRLLVETFYPLGLLRAWTWIDFDCKALIYPRPLFQDVIKESATTNEDGEIIQLDGNDDYDDMRSYREGDPVKHIVWRTYARLDELIVKQFAGYKDMQIMLDWHQLNGNIENRLSRLTGLALTAARSNKEFGLLLPGIEIKPSIGAIHLEQILKELALYDLA